MKKSNRAKYIEWQVFCCFLLIEPGAFPIIDKINDIILYPFSLIYPYLTMLFVILRYTISLLTQSIIYKNHKFSWCIQQAFQLIQSLFRHV